MPVAYIDVPFGIRIEAKRMLVKAVFEAIHDAYPIPDTRIMLREWPLENVSQDGRLDSEPLRPICGLEVPPGASVEVKRKLVDRISAAIADAYRLPKQDVPLPSGTVVSTNWVLTFFREYPLEQAALDGLLAIENPMVLESIQQAMKNATDGAQQLAAG
jgi:phenylpyruvate tautomerase PptA (4-oxalocrotonate tautomerase family)